MDQNESMTTEHVGMLIVGGGQAGGEIAAELRRQKYEGRVLIVGDEKFLPYKRPPLSKAYFAGSVQEENLYVMQQANLDKAQIEYRGGVAAARIDRAGKALHLADGRAYSYDKLALATGGRARGLSVPGADKSNVFALRTIADVQKIRALCAPGRRMCIVGGGFIGLEVAAVAIKLGLKVTLLEGLPRVLARVTVPQVSEFFERMHREAGVDLRTSAQLKSFEGGAAVTHVALGDGTQIETDVVVVGIGILPNVELAQAAGIACDNGIVVDSATRTNDPDIVAAGDCTNHPSDFLNRRVRLESVQNAMEQARAAAHAMLGREVNYQMVPWFWSDQYDLKLQMVGISTGFDQVIFRGDLKTQRNFAAFYLGDGKIIAADTVSRPQEFMLAKKLVAAKAKLDPAKLADESVPLKDLVPA
ncbi:MAG TPA: FAD-dependent oxidoreductase [Nevskiaceae bacterium]|nr:FAD-dependent oxidoreductase [Nevskiaceae bacterium]